MQFHIGCSGYSYREWKEIFYPKGLPAKDWFHFYTTHFSMLELNNTFYNFPKLKNLQSWYSKAPDDFIFVVKAPRTITHHKKLKDCADLINEFYNVCNEGLQEKLGCLIFQMPPSYHYSEENLARIINAADKNFTTVFELRHASWWNTNVYKAFKENHIVFCSVSFPELNDDVVTTSETLYYRFHGIPDLYFSTYSEEALKIIADKIIEEKENIQTVYCAFNNTGNLGAIDNAKWIRNYFENNF